MKNKNLDIITKLLSVIVVLLIVLIVVLVVTPMGKNNTSLLQKICHTQNTSLSEDKLLSIFYEKVSDTKPDYTVTDLDKNGTTEMFAVIQNNNYMQEIWYLSGDGKSISKINTTEYPLDNVSFDTIDYDKETHLIINSSNDAGSGVTSNIIGMKTDGPILYLNNKIGLVKKNNNDILFEVQAYDASFDPSVGTLGHTWKNTYIFFDGKKYCEYIAKEYHDLDFSEYNGLEKHISKIKGNIEDLMIENYYIRDNGIIQIQCSTPDKSLYNGRNFFYYTAKHNNGIVTEFHDKTDGIMSTALFEPLPSTEREPSIYLEYYPEGHLQYKPVELHSGKGYSIYMPKYDFIFSNTSSGNITEEVWSPQFNEYFTLKVTTYENTDKESAKKIFKEANSQFDIEDFEYNTSGGMERKKGYIYFKIHSDNKNTYILSSTYSLEAWDGFGTLATSIFNTFKTDIDNTPKENIYHAYKSALESYSLRYDDQYASYYLYDINNDKIPELIYESNSTCYVKTFISDGLIDCGEYYSKYGLYYHKTSLLRTNGGTGHLDYIKVSLNKNMMIQQEDTPFLSREQLEPNPESTVYHHNGDKISKEEHTAIDAEIHKIESCSADSFELLEILK